MSTIKVIINCNDDGTPTRKSVFGTDGLFDCEAFVDMVYGMPAVIASSMGKLAMPALGRLCPSVVVVKGSWITREVAARVARDTENDMDVVFFADDETYRDLLDCDSISEVIVMVPSGKDCNTEFRYRGWQKESRIEPAPDGTALYRYIRAGGLDISEDDLTDEIAKLERDMSDETREPLTPKEKKDIDHLYKTIVQGWKLFNDAGNNMDYLLEHGEMDYEEKEFGDCEWDDDYDPDDGLDESPAELTKRLLGEMSPEEKERLEKIALGAPAPLLLVKEMANTVKLLGEKLVECKEAIKDIKESDAKELARAIDVVADSMKETEQYARGLFDTCESEISGLRNQVSVVVREHRMSWAIPLAVAATSLIISILALVLFLVVRV